MPTYKVNLESFNRYYIGFHFNFSETEMNEAILEIEQTEAVMVCILFKNQQETENMFPVELTDCLKKLVQAIEKNDHILAFDANLDTHPTFYNSEQKKLFFTPILFKKMLITFELDNNIFLGNGCLNLILNNESIEKHIFNTDELKQVLSRFFQGRQLFNHSCAAHSIMQYFFAAGIIENPSILSECEIYPEIWQAKGNPADPQKIKTFLEKQNVDVSLIEEEKVAQKLLEEMPDMTMQYQYMHSIFAKKIFKNITEESFPVNTGLLMIVECGKHIISAMRMHNGEIMLHNTHCTIKRSFKTVNDFKASQWEKLSQEQQSLPSLKGFTGLAIRMFFDTELRADRKLNAIPTIMTSKSDMFL